MKIALLLLSTLFFVSGVCSGEIVFITQPMPDMNGDEWAREYIGVSLPVLYMPDSLGYDSPTGRVRVYPSSTGRIKVTRGVSTVVDSWVNIIDINRGRYYAGDIERWSDLDSVEAIRIGEGFDTCAIYFRTCPRPGAPIDSCETTRHVLHDGIDISSIEYIVFTSFDNVDKHRKSGYYYRKLLGFISREVDYSVYLDMTGTDSTSFPISATWIHSFGKLSIRRVHYMNRDTEGR